MSNITYHVLLFTAANVRETGHAIPSWTCEKTHDCKLISTIDVGGLFFAVPVRRLIESYESCSCKAGVYTSTCRWKYFGTKEWKNEKMATTGMSVQRCEDMCNNGPKGLELQSPEACRWWTRGNTRSVSGIEVTVNSDQFEFSKFVKQTQGKNYDLERAEHTIYRDVKLIENLLDAMIDDAKYSLHKESFRGLNYIWIGNECEIELASGSGWILTPNNLYFQRKLDQEQLRKILNFETGLVSEGFVRAIVFDSTKELQKACVSYSPERLCEKMADRVDAYETNKMFGFNILTTKKANKRSIFECKMEKKTMNNWRWMTDHYYTTVNDSMIFHVKEAEISDVKLPSAIRWSENYHNYIITNDDRAEKWTKKDVENNITVMLYEDPYRVEERQNSIKDVLWTIRNKILATSKETMVKVLLVILGLLASFAMVVKMAKGFADCILKLKPEPETKTIVKTHSV